MDIYTFFIYNTVNCYNLFQEYIEEKLCSNDSNNNKIREGFLIKKNYYDYWRSFTDFDSIKNKIRNKSFNQAKPIILEYRRRNKLKKYQNDAEQYYFTSPKQLYNAIMEEGHSFVLIGKNCFQQICRDESLDEKGMKYLLDNNKIIFVFNKLGNCEVTTYDNIIDNSKEININSPNETFKSSFGNTTYSYNRNNKEQLELEKLLLLYAFEQEMKRKINDLTYQENNFQNYALISKDWINEYKRIYHYDEICSMVKRKDSLKALLDNGYSNAKKNLPLILQKIGFNRKYNQVNFPNELKDNNTFLTENGEVELSNGNKVKFWRDFEIVNEDLKNLFAKSEFHNYNFNNYSDAKCLIASGKVIINLSDIDSNSENEYSLEVGIINNMDMIYNDEFIFNYDDEEAENDNLEHFKKDFMKFQREYLLFEINLETELLSRNGTHYGIAFKIPPH